MRKLLVAAMAVTGLWLAGAMPTHAQLIPSCDVVVSADITTSTTWTANNQYCLDNQIYVTNGATLTIEPGTIVRGDPESAAGAKDPGALIITRGAKIQAAGTPDLPIVFTDLDDDNVRGFPGSAPYDSAENARALTANWGGVILLNYGYVANNTSAGPDPTREFQIEGLDPNAGKGLYGNCAAFLPGPYGRNCDDDDSGTITYTSIRYGGFVIGANNEINGLTLGGVGRETDLDSIEVVQNKDDCIEFFGGAANVRRFIGAACGDDGIDYDEGWRGKVQFAFIMQGLPGPDKSDKGGEWDGGNAPDTSQPRTIPLLYNVTMVGHGQKSTYTDRLKNTALHIRDNAGARVHNSAFLDFGGATMLVEGTGTSCQGAGSSGERYSTNYTADGVYYLGPDEASDKELYFTNNSWWCAGSEAIPERVPGARCSVTTGQACCTNADCPSGETCVDEGVNYGGDTGKLHRGRTNLDVFSNGALANEYLTCASALPIRGLVREPLADATKPDPIESIDPRPVPGSPLLSGAKTAPVDGFFEPVTYRGAFGARNWAEGWSTLARLGYFPPRPQVNVSADITTSQTWTESNEYVLQNQVYVTNGATLTIEPGTIVRSEPESAAGAKDPGALIITRGAKIQAAGTPDLPIVFTDLDDDNVRGFPGSAPYDSAENARALTANWGGVILLNYGYVANNTSAGPDPTREFQIEGLDPNAGKGLYGNCAAFLPGPYGRNCDDDDSGTITYTSIRYGGFVIGANNEINGLTLGGVGRETDLDSIEVVQNKDDCIEFFGGAANVRRFIGAACGDDGIDYDEGWRGKVQFAFIMQGLPGPDKSDKGGEWDGGNAPDTSQPRTIPLLYNVTMVGHGQKSTYTDRLKNTALHIRDNAGARVHNSAFLDFGGATMLVEGTGTSCQGAGSSGERYSTNYTADGVYYLGPDEASDKELYFTNNSWWCAGSEAIPERVPGARCSVTTGQACCTNADCPSGETCVDEGVNYGGDTGKLHRGRTNLDVFSNGALANEYLTCASALPIRGLVREPLADATKPDPTVLIDPRPSDTSSLKTNVKSVPADGFLAPVSYRGAFANPNNWAVGWSTLSRLGYFPKCDLVDFPSAVPDEVEGVAFLNKEILSWNALAFNNLGYDVVRSTSASDFTTGTCVEKGDGDTAATDAAVPASGQVFHYLVRGGNPCGVGTLGYRSNGVERTGVVCP